MRHLHSLRGDDCKRNRTLRYPYRSHGNHYHYLPVRWREPNRSDGRHSVSRWQSHSVRGRRGGHALRDGRACMQRSGNRGHRAYSVRVRRDSARYRFSIAVKQRKRPAGRFLVFAIGSPWSVAFSLSGSLFASIRKAPAAPQGIPKSESGKRAKNVGNNCEFHPFFFAGKRNKAAYRH